jgi:hypothetical protein
MGILSTLQPVPDQATATNTPAANQSDGQAAPGWGDTIGAAFRSSMDSGPMIANARLDQAYAGLAGQLSQANGKPVSNYYMPPEAQIANAYGADQTFDRDKILSDLAALRAQNPDALANVPSDQATFEAQAMGRGGKHQQDQALAARGGIVPNLIGGMSGMFTDPPMVFSALLGGPELPMAARAILGEGLAFKLASAAAANATIAAAQEPATLAVRSQMGDDITPGSVAGDIGGAALFGTVVHGAGMALGKAATPIANALQGAGESVAHAAYSAMPDSVLANHFGDAVPMIDRTPDQQAAFNVLSRQAQVDATSPYQPSYAAMAVHQARLGQAMADLDGGRVPGQTAAFAPHSSEGASPGYFSQLAQVESSNNPLAQAKTSSAGGLYQFTDGTFLNLYKQRYGADGQSNAAILAQKLDPAVQDTLIRDLTATNASYLSRHGVAVDDGGLYLAHFAGPDGAVKLMAADPGASAASVLGERAVKANPFLADMNAGEVRAWADRKMGGTGEQGLPGLPESGGGAPDDDIRAMMAEQDGAEPDAENAGEAPGDQAPMDAETDAGRPTSEAEPVDLAPRADAPEPETRIELDALRAPAPETPSDIEFVARYEPDGAGVRAQADNTWHDLLMADQAREAAGQPPMLFDMDDGAGPRRASAIFAEMDGDQQALDTIGACLKPGAAA